MNEEKQIEEMAKCCPYYHKGECCADVLNICDCDLMCEMFGVFANLAGHGYRKQSEGEVLEALDKFRDLLVNKFIELCDYNDYGRINLLLIGETINRIYDRCVDDMKGGAE